MKKVLVALSLICFVAVSSVSAQSPATATASKEKAPVATAATPAAPAATATANEAPAASCHGSAKKSCCKNGDAKACTPAQRAACGDHAKAESTAPKSESTTSKN